jgi:hypothetical protein
MSQLRKWSSVVSLLSGKAITLCMPITVKRKAEDPSGRADPDQPATFTRFVYRPN